MKCPNCGAESAPGERFCGHCGQTLPDPTATQPLPAGGPPAPYVSAAPPPAYSAGSPAPPPYVPPPVPPVPVAAEGRDPQTAMILEVIAGLFGFLGIGHFYAGRTNTGLALLIGWWVFLGVEVMLMAVLIGCLLLPLNVIVPVVSGIWVRNELQGQPTRILGMSLGSTK